MSSRSNSASVSNGNQLASQDRRHLLLDAGGGATYASLEFYRSYKDAFGPVERVWVTQDDEDALSFGFHGYGFFDSPPSLVLRNASKDEMWLSACACGYGGEGPHGTEQILFDQGFPEPILELVTGNKVLVLDAGAEVPVWAVPQDYGRTSIWPWRNRSS